MFRSASCDAPTSVAAGGCCATACVADTVLKLPARIAVERTNLMVYSFRR
jgi:hypothetical protein